ncbi:inner membrane protein [Draconibacterium orientale]|uniref:Membrane protein n=1 Tax=Draconibacterium orientale TaxID=1168034 RepID=X5DCE9_9BACT|nr:cell envelope integrity protein CreD [Draconibacterium orientale]AHW60503.1 membrane protein [Draconibacterium orientale]SET43785.1 inner membrane protein [Draconibacterium orientale]
MEKQDNILDRLGISFHRTLSFKLLVIGMLILILLIPKVMIMELIGERQSNSFQVVNEVMSKWSNEQLISGPVLFVPLKKKIYNEEDDTYNEVTRYATFLPKELSVNGTLLPIKLQRSIYNVDVYEAELAITGNFKDIDLEKLNIESSDIIWDDAQLQLSISDLRGINNGLELRWNDKAYTFSPGKTSSPIGHSGVSIPLKELYTSDLNGVFSIKLQLKGSQNLMFTPLGEQTSVRLESTWNDPGFTGNYLPADRNVDDKGFQADWSVLHFNRNYPQQWISTNNTLNQNDIENSKFGVEMVSLADHYQKNVRSAKYAILIIIITFVVFFMFEVLSKQRIHPFQYIMVGSAISIFYLLLLSISEHLGFNLAYLVAALAVIILVLFYTRSFMPELKTQLGTSFGLAGCYLFIFILLQLESFALLTGSIGLFVLLAALMYSTRKVNWYKE